MVFDLCGHVENTSPRQTSGVDNFPAGGRDIQIKCPFLPVALSLSLCFVLSFLSLRPLSVCVGVCRVSACNNACTRMLAMCVYLSVFECISAGARVCQGSRTTSHMRVISPYQSPTVGGRLAPQQQLDHGNVAVLRPGHQRREPTAAAARRHRPPGEAAKLANLQETNKLLDQFYFEFDPVS